MLENDFDLRNFRPCKMNKEVTAYDLKYFRLSERKKLSYLLGFSERRKRWIRRLWEVV